MTVKNLDLIEQKYVRKKIPCCKENKCKLKLNGLKKQIILKGEKFTTVEKISDCFIFGYSSKYVVGIVELKSKSINISSTKTKFRNSLKIVVSITQKYLKKDTPVYLLILAKSWSSIDYKQFTKNTITYDGKKYYIRPKRCGDVFLNTIK